MRTKLISGVIAASMFLPVAANAGAPETDCYLTPTAEVCAPEEPEVRSEVEVHEDEAEVLVVSEAALPDTGVDTWMILSLALGLLALGGATLARTSRRRQSDPAAR